MTKEPIPATNPAPRGLPECPFFIRAPFVRTPGRRMMKSALRKNPFGHGQPEGGFSFAPLSPPKSRRWSETPPFFRSSTTLSASRAEQTIELGRDNHVALA